MLDGSIRIWDARTGEQLAAFPAHRERTSCVCFLPDSRLASGGYDKLIRIWDFHRGGPPVVLTGHKWGLKCLSASIDGRTIASGGMDGTLRVWDVEKAQEVGLRNCHDSTVACVAFSPLGQLLASGGDDRIVRIWRYGKIAGQDVVPSIELRIQSVAFSADGQQLAIGLNNGRAQLGNLHGSFALPEMKHDWGPVSGVSFSADGRFLATCGTGFDAVRVWNTSTGECASVFGLFGAKECQVAFSPRGQRILASFGSANEPRIWEMGPSANLYNVQCLELAGHKGSIWSIAWSPNGALVATTGDTFNAIVRVFDSNTGNLVHALTGHTKHVTAVAFSSNGKRLASKSDDGSIRIWALDDGSCVDQRMDVFDVVSAAEGLETHPWQIRRDALQTTIEDARNGKQLGWLPLEAWSRLATHPSGRIWATSMGSRLAVFQLEDDRSSGCDL